MKVRVRYTATFDAIIEVRDGASIEEISDATFNLTIPEHEHSTYQDDSFDPVTDENDNPQLFDRNGLPITLEQARQLQA